jgi:Tfp pilus assembly protein PilF
MGLGMVSFKQEQYKLAKVSYQKALRLNPKSTVVLCHIALVSDLKDWFFTKKFEEVWSSLWR